MYAGDSGLDTGASISAAGSPVGGLPPWVWPRAAYAHIPFCAHHCGYCDFAVATGAEASVDRYIDALAAELSALGEPQPVETLSLGGGTPSHLAARQLDRLFGVLDRWLPRLPGAECSLEANPDSVDPEKIAVLAGHGVNRVSLGVQSFRPELLRVLERAHDPDQVTRVVGWVRQRIPVLSLDLIFGVPGQTLTDWESDLARALALGPDHLSTYGLTFEKGTRLWKQRRAGQVRPVGDDLERDMYLRAMDVLGENGFEHYEISNFARPGRRSRHNQVYWANEAYFGVGMGAARYVRGRREVNTRNLQDYLDRALGGRPTAAQSEELGPEPRARETLAMHLRRGDGVDRRRFREQTGFEVDALAGPKLRAHRDLGLVVDDGSAVRLSREGKCVADAIVCDIL